MEVGRVFGLGGAGIWPTPPAHAQTGHRPTHVIYRLQSKDSLSAGRHPAILTLHLAHFEIEVQSAIF